MVGPTVDVLNLSTVLKQRGRTFLFLLHPVVHSLDLPQTFHSIDGDVTNFHPSPDVPSPHGLDDNGHVYWCT